MILCLVTICDYRQLCCNSIRKNRRNFPTRAQPEIILRGGVRPTNRKRSDNRRSGAAKSTFFKKSGVKLRIIRTLLNLLPTVLYRMARIAFILILLHSFLSITPPPFKTFYTPLMVLFVYNLFTFVFQDTRRGVSGKDFLMPCGIGLRAHLAISNIQYLTQFGVWKHGCSR